MKTRHCDECKYFDGMFVLPITKKIFVCTLRHRPRYYKQKHDNPHDTNYGWKMKCIDYVEDGK